MSEIIIKQFIDDVPVDKKIGQKPVMLFTKSIKGKRNLPIDKVWNATLGTTHTIIPDENGINGLCNWFESLTTTCPHCGLAKINREFWATEDYAIMFCDDCKFYTWKDHQSNIEKAYNDTNFKSIVAKKRKMVIPPDWRRHV